MFTPLYIAIKLIKAKINLKKLQSTELAKFKLVNRSSPEKEAISPLFALKKTCKFLIFSEVSKAKTNITKDGVKTEIVAIRAPKKPFNK
jgi:hypothetical protein